MTPADRQGHLVEAAGPDGRRRGRDYCRALATLTDDWVVAVFDEARRQHGVDDVRSHCSPSAGYGRGELARPAISTSCSSTTPSRRRFASSSNRSRGAIWYPVWDSGVKLGHAVRSVDEQLALARDDLDTATAMLTARPIAGDDELATR